MHESDRLMVLEPSHDLYEGGECDQMEDTLTRLAEQGMQIVVDLTRVQHVTARCLGILAHAHHVAAQQGGFIVLCGVTRMQRWLLHETGLEGVLSIHEDVAAAKRYAATHRRAVA